MLLQQSFSCKVHFFAEGIFFWILSLQTWALPRMAVPTSLLQQKCMSTLKEDVLNSIETVKKKDTILAKRYFTCQMYEKNGWFKKLHRDN